MQPDVRHVNSWLSDFLHRLRQAEAVATGPERRAAFRRSRETLGAAVGCGIPTRELADCLGVTAASVRNRAVYLGGTISASEISLLTMLTPEAIDRNTAGRLAAVVEEQGGVYRIDHLVAALLGLPAETFERS